MVNSPALDRAEEAGGGSCEICDPSNIQNLLSNPTHVDQHSAPSYIYMDYLYQSTPNRLKLLGNFQARGVKHGWKYTEHLGGLILVLTHIFL